MGVQQSNSMADIVFIKLGWFVPIWDPIVDPYSYVICNVETHIAAGWRCLAFELPLSVTLFSTDIFRLYYFQFSLIGFPCLIVTRIYKSWQHTVQHYNYLIVTIPCHLVDLNEHVIHTSVGSFVFAFLLLLFSLFFGGGLVVGSKFLLGL